MSVSSGRRQLLRLREVRVAVDLDATRQWTRRVITGIVRYANAQGRWRLFTSNRLGLNLLKQNDPRKFDGAIVPAYNKSIWPDDVPSVYIGTPPPDTLFGPTFTIDNRAVAAMAASHLIEIGFPNIAYVGIANTTFSTARSQFFHEELEKRGRHVIAVDVASRHVKGPNAHVQHLLKWLKRVPLPCAVFAADDELAALLVTTARELGLRIPEELAVLGFNDDELWCSSVVPSLSSMAMAADEMGWAAAEHLDSVMRSRAKYGNDLRLFPPKGLVLRQSTDVVGFSNPIVSEAVRLVRSRAPHEAVTVKQIAADLHVSRQYLSMSFTKQVGRSVKEEVDRVRIELIREELQNGTRSPKELTHRMGFSDLSQFSRFCRRLLGESPRSIAKQRA